ncbi:MAG: hypothetical protein XD91_0074 [Clostridiales bacterium 38_11]|nr:MAG: hypothetical protein XD91_0074 [Clostridiales bacterium 38_11]HBH12965.1 hypothetical protein [Clostridiales bacterium]
MDKALKKTLAWTGIGLLLLLILIVVNQINQIFIAASTIHPAFGRLVTILLSMFFAVIFLVPLFGFLKLRKPLELPDETNSETYVKYLNALKKRLMRNSYIREANFTFDENLALLPQIEAAHEVLNQKTFKIIKESSSTVFLTTAVSQNGILDSFFVLTNLSRMVWQISHIYNQRPNVKEILYLYANVAATVLMAREIEDLALMDEQLQPVINSLIGGTLGTLVPGATAVTNLIINSIIQGSANAFLTLRVGIIARKYSSSLTQIDKGLIKRSATLESCGMLGIIVQQNSVSIIKAFVTASKKATIDRTVDKIKDSANKTGNFVKDIFNKQ